MVTGIETAGLVLALFPLIISILEQYKEGFETIQEWWNFRTEFLHFIRAIGRQSILFSENLEELLAPMVTSDAEMDALLTTPLGDRWRDPELEERLKDRLPKSYELYLHTIDEVLEVMEKIKARLGIKRGQVIPPSKLSCEGRLAKLYGITTEYFDRQRGCLTRQDEMGLRVPTV